MANSNPAAMDDKTQSKSVLKGQHQADKENSSPSEDDDDLQMPSSLTMYDSVSSEEEEEETTQSMKMISEVMDRICG